MSKHIKGPWRWDGNPCSYDASIEAPWLVSASNGADVILKGQIDCTSEEAARLIAAAPELLQALNGALSMWNRLYPLMPVDERIEDGEFREMQRVRAAIAKATGGQQ